MEALGFQDPLHFIELTNNAGLSFNRALVNFSSTMVPSCSGRTFNLAAASSIVTCMQSTDPVCFLLSVSFVSVDICGQDLVVLPFA